MVNTLQFFISNRYNKKYIIFTDDLVVSRRCFAKVVIRDHVFQVKQVLYSNFILLSVKRNAVYNLSWLAYKGLRGWNLITPSIAEKRPPTSVGIEKKTGKIMGSIFFSISILQG